jgi:hypothetical protein
MLPARRAEMDKDRLERCGANIAARIGDPPSQCALVVASLGKQDVAEAVARGLGHAGVEAHLLVLGPTTASGAARLQDWIRSLVPQWGLALLMQPGDAAFLFGLAGRPDQGLTLPHTHLFCDWLITPDSLVRTLGVDLHEQERFRAALLRALWGSRLLRVTTPAGTDLRLTPRAWLSSEGEVYTAPVEESVQGRVVADGPVYDRPARVPLLLSIADGRVTNVPDLDLDDDQQSMAHKDLLRDPCARRVAELGLGVNLGADPDAEIMEGEQARGTCHVGFGANHAFGGATECRYHVDFCMRAPSIEVDGRVICREGRYTLSGCPE